MLSGGAGRWAIDQLGDRGRRRNGDLDVEATMLHLASRMNAPPWGQNGRFGEAAQ